MILLLMNFPHTIYALHTSLFLVQPDKFTSTLSIKIQLKDEKTQKKLFSFNDERKMK
jgi:hypothetical protein